MTTFAVTHTYKVLQSTELSRLLFPQVNFYLVFFAPNIRNKGKQNTDLCHAMVICQIEVYQKLCQNIKFGVFFTLKDPRGSLSFVYIKSVYINVCVHILLCSG